MFKLAHCNINVLDLEKSIAFYKEALGLSEQRRIEAKDGSFTLAFVGNDETEFNIELTCLHDKTEPYDLGDNESHIAFVTDDIEAAHKKHEEMGCICFENPGMGIYFIHDPDDYWIEIIPLRK